MSTIPLAKGFDESKLEFPVYVSLKIDGVPVRIDITADGHTVQSRQGKPVPSVTTLVEGFVARYRELDGPMPMAFVGEVHQAHYTFADFKDTSGIVRREEDAGLRLYIAFFDCSHPGNFTERYSFMQRFSSDNAEVMYQTRCDTLTGLYSEIQSLQTMFPRAEGLVLRNHTNMWNPGKRDWGYQKYLVEPTIDLRIVSVEEAIDQYGNPKGMVGRLNAKYKDQIIGIGPGKLTHAERVKLWADYGKSYPLPDGLGIAQIKYKKDDSYDALRQPTFQHWRDDKDTPDC